MSYVSKGNWERHAVCACGHYRYMHFSDIFFVKNHICKGCGKSFEFAKVIVRRKVTTYSLKPPFINQDYETQEYGISTG